MMNIKQIVDDLTQHHAYQTWLWIHSDGQATHSQPSEPLTLEKLREVIAKFRAQPKLVVAYVVRPRLEWTIRQQVEAGTRIPFCREIEIYSDLDQETDILAFADRVLLRAYLNRMTHPLAYLKAVESAKAERPEHERMREYMQMTGEWKE